MIQMPTFDPALFGANLREAMKGRGFDVKTLQKEVAREVARQTGKTRGTSYGTIWSYVNNQAPLEPRREVVEALATLLDRLPDNLMFGTGPKTQREAEALLLQQSEAESRPSKEPHKEAFREWLPFDDLGSVARGQLWRLWGAFYDLHCVRREWMGETISPEDEHEVGGVESARVIAKALRKPLDDMDLIARPATKSMGQFHGAFGWDLDSYIIQASEGLLQLVDQQRARIIRYREAKAEVTRLGESQQSSIEPKEDDDGEA